MTKKKTKTNSNSISYIYGGIYLLVSAIALLHERTGLLGDFLYHCSNWLFGDFWYLFYGFLCVIAFYYFYHHHAPKWSSKIILSLALGLIALFIFMGIPEDKSTGINVIKNFMMQAKDIFNGIYPTRGGLCGAVLYGLISAAVSYWGAIVVGVIMAILAVFILVGFDKIADGTVAGTKAAGNVLSKTTGAVVKTAKNAISSREKPRKSDITASRKKEVPVTDGEQLKLDNFDDLSDQVPEVRKPPKKETAASVSEPVVATTSAGTVAPSSNYKLPNLSMMLDNIAVTNTKNNRNAAVKKGEELIDLLEDFDVRCSLEGIKIGPSITQFEIKPISGTRLNKITALSENIKMGLAVRDVRIEAPIPGKSVVGVEIPNESRAKVQMKEMLMQIPDKYKNNPLTVTLGKDVSGERIYGEIDRMPHLLIGGSTNSGKSVCVNSFICSILLRTKPEDVKLLLIDPKMVEFEAYRDIPHLIAPVISDPNEASVALQKIVKIMENRYSDFKKNGVRNISEYNQKAEKEGTNKMFYIVVIIDELADLMMTNEKDVVASIQRITQLARASGIHLITATQRPSTDVITGTIKANMNSRIAFTVSSAIDSRIILDQPGAETLLGYGDMLYIPMGESSARRIQGVYVSDDEIKRITEYCRNQQMPSYDDAFIVPELGPNEVAEMQSADPQYEDVKRFVITTGKASTSSIQRYFGFGYNRSARIIDFLEKEGIVGPANGSKPREVFYSQDDIDNGRI